MELNMRTAPEDTARREENLRRTGKRYPVPDPRVAGLKRPKAPKKPPRHVDLLLARRRAGLTLEQLAEAAGISAKLLARYESYRGAPTPADMRRLLAALRRGG